jgi:hypothetical protein
MSSENAVTSDFYQTFQEGILGKLFPKIEECTLPSVF